MAIVPQDQLMNNNYSKSAIIDKARPIIVTGAAGLVGQNLIPQLKARGFTQIIGIDKHPQNTATLRKLHPDITVIEVDLSQPGEWEGVFDDASAVVMNHAQIGGLDPDAFTQNNVTASHNVIAAMQRFHVSYMVAISSSVVESVVVDNYTETKKEQERLVLESGIACCVLRPTLMFGWFDRKHLGWLARFMQKMPIFPIPSDGKFVRQPLYCGDFCNIIISCIEQKRSGEVHNISGREKVYYIDLVRALKKATSANAFILPIPYWLFWSLLKLYSLVDRDPPFTTKQLKALTTPEVFEIIDWPAIFGVQQTLLQDAIENTFQHPVYANITLEY
jgi:nucleoside-diphosphate-sugar epimerase